MQPDSLDGRCCPGLFLTGLYIFISQVENRGIAKGKAEGEDTLALLMKKLFDQNRIEDAKRASEDKEYRARLMKEFGIS